MSRDVISPLIVSFITPMLANYDTTYEPAEALPGVALIICQPLESKFFLSGKRSSDLVSKLLGCAVLLVFSLSN